MSSVIFINPIDEEYTLIEKIVAGYSILTTKPDDWETNYTNYYKNTGTLVSPAYAALTNYEEFAPGLYYKYSPNGVNLSRSKTPYGENYHYKKLMLRIQTSSNQQAGYCYWYLGASQYANYEWQSGSKYYVYEFIPTSQGTVATFSAHGWEWRNNPDKNFATSFYEGVKDYVTYFGQNQMSLSSGSVVWIYGVK